MKRAYVAGKPYYLSGALGFLIRKFDKECTSNLNRKKNVKEDSSSDSDIECTYKGIFEDESENDEPLQLEYIIKVKKKPNNYSKATVKGPENSLNKAEILSMLKMVGGNPFGKRKTPSKK